MRAEMMGFIASLSICLIGGVALAAYALRFRSRERDLLWIGMFAVLYGADLLLHNPLFQLGFGDAPGSAVFMPRILSACSIIPALLLFKEFYGRGWRSLLHWMIVGYAVAAAGVYGYMATSHRPEMMPSAGLLLVRLRTGCARDWPPLGVQAAAARECEGLVHRTVLFLPRLLGGPSAQRAGRSVETGSGAIRIYHPAVVSKFRGHSTSTHRRAASGFTHSGNAGRGGDTGLNPAAIDSAA